MIDKADMSVTLDHARHEKSTLSLDDHGPFGNDILARAADRLDPVCLYLHIARFGFT
jgi:hypothetical protein